MTGAASQAERLEDRLHDLLVLRATGTISAAESQALEAMLRILPAGEGARWESAAAELSAALVDSERAAVPMPAALADRVIASGERVVRESQPRAVGSARSVRSRALAWSGWLAAAALLAVTLSRPAVDSGPADGGVSRGAFLRDSLLAADAGTTRLPWKATDDSTARGASGDVVWSARAGTGVMRIAGLTPNDRRRWQYQLWIFDRGRDARYPVDGGVFDIPEGATEVFVPIDARLPVGEATMFAVTVEPPGGVVVSSRARVALLAGGS